MKKRFKEILLETLETLAIIGIVLVAFMGAVTLLYLWIKWMFPL